MSSNNKFSLTYPNKINISPVDFSEPGATTLLISAILMYSTIFLAGKKKRSIGASTMATDLSLQIQEKLLLKVLVDLDSEDCVALAVCFEASKLPENRTEGQERLLLLAGNNPEYPMRWSDMESRESKYHYAGYVGIRSRMNQDTSNCLRVFDKCKTDPEKIDNILAKEINMCNNMIISP